MCYTSRKRSFLSHRLRPCGFLIILTLSTLPVLASTTNKILVRDSVSPSDREELLRRLRTITGWTDLVFSRDGALQTTDNHIGGSQSARELLTRAVSGSRTIVFEDASSRKDVVFCRVILGKLEPNLSASEVDVIQIDFNDFRHVTGDKEARAAFDVGWAVLHEIDHAVVDSRDPTHDDDVAGDCEDHINEMRRELGLPVRNSYFYTLLPVKNDSNFISRFVRLSFEENGPASKRRRYWLIWDAAVVGGLS